MGSVTLTIVASLYCRSGGTSVEQFQRLSSQIRLYSVNVTMPLVGFQVGVRPNYKVIFPSEDVDRGLRRRAGFCAVDLAQVDLHSHLDGAGDLVQHVGSLVHPGAVEEPLVERQHWKVAGPEARSLLWPWSGGVRLLDVRETLWKRGKGQNE